MEKRLTFDHENRERIKAVDGSFRPAGKSLAIPGRVLMGEGRLLKQSRKKAQTKVFFLFNDVIVYGSILLNGWNKRQKIIPLENIKLEDMADSATLKNQWLIRTPRKSFYVAAPTLEEKRAWMQHIEDCKATLLQQGHTASSDFAMSWMPDNASSVCLLCKVKFTPTNRRHHCRMCGLLVCDKCSKDKAVIEHISITKKQRVCGPCHKKQEEVSRSRGNSEEDDLVESSDDEEVDDSLLYQSSSSWLDSRMGTWSTISNYITIVPATR